MADKTVGELTRATHIGLLDLFVLEQDGQAKSLTGRTLVNDLAEALDGHGGIKEIIKNEDYTLTFIMADETEISIGNVRGPQGVQGEPGIDGVDGRGITQVTKISSYGVVDTYSIAFTDGSSSTFQVTNGSSIATITKTSTDGIVDTYTVTLTDGSTSTFQVTNGNGIASVTLQDGNHAPGTYDTYRITFDNGNFSEFEVYNGLNGEGAVSSVNGVEPDLTGNISLDASQIPVSKDSSVSVGEDLDNRVSKEAGKGLSANDFTDDYRQKLDGIEEGANKFTLADSAVTAAKIAANAVSKTLTVTLAVASWASKKITVTATGVTASNTVIVSPAPASFLAYTEAQVRCISQAANSLTFQCESVPTAALTVNVCYINK